MRYNLLKVSFLPIFSLNVYPIQSTYRGYFGLVVVTSLRLRPRFIVYAITQKNPYRIASIFYMLIDIGERIAGKQDRPSLSICFTFWLI